MKQRKPVESPSLYLFDRLDGDAKNRLLLRWLEDDDHRAQLFQLITDKRGGLLDFPSRTAEADPCCIDDDHPRPPPEVGHQTVRLITRRNLIEQALKDGGIDYSSRVYGELGGGNFTLALDPAIAGHDTAQKAQLAALCHAFPHDPGLIALVAHHACDAAAVLSLRSQDFDLAAFAEQAALRFCQYLFGYASTDFPVMEDALRKSYQALVYQVLGRHFTTDPVAIPAAKAAMGGLLRRTAALIDAYADDDKDALKGCHRPGVLAGVQPVLEKLGKYANELNGEQRAIVAVGAAAGTVGNVQAAVCIAVQALFADTKAAAEARTLALDSTDPGHRPSKQHDKWQKLIVGALNRNPPIAFLPRLQIVKPTAPGGQTRYQQVLLALGGGTGAASARIDDEDLLIWGLPGKHACFGTFLAWPLIVETVRHVMRLPGLEQRLDPQDARVMGLEKRWGFICKSYPLTYRRDRRVAQSSLNVHMRIKQPVKENASRLRTVIRAGAPRIDEVLRESRHVHFAWFEFIERDTVLVLHTVYDGDFAAYIQHFALRVGDLFDTLFESIEEAPPTPVAEYPNEFVALIRRYDRNPALGYFFSAYPRSEAAAITRMETGRP